jgi:hypothetical protein
MNGKSKYKMLEIQTLQIVPPTLPKLLVKVPIMMSTSSLFTLRCSQIPRPVGPVQVMNIKQRFSRKMKKGLPIAPMECASSKYKKQLYLQKIRD